MDCSLPGSSVHGDSPSKNTGVGCHALLQGIFPTQGLNPGLPHCRWILYHLSHQGSASILKWVAYPFSRGTYQPRNQAGVSCIGFFWLSSKESACNAGDPGSIPGLGRSPAEGNGYPLQYSGLENPMARRALVQSMGSQSVGHNRMTNIFIFFFR